MLKVAFQMSPKTGEKTDIRWLGPGIVVEQVGHGSYKVQMEEERVIEAPEKFLKRYLEDLVGGGFPLFFHRRTTQRALVETGEAVEEVLGHKKEGGKLWFLVGFVGEGDSHWLNADYFLQKFDEGWRKYCDRKGLKVDVAKDMEEALE